MPVTKTKLLMLASDGTGKAEDAAKALGIQPKSIRDWKVDQHGHVRNRRIIDAVIAAMVRHRQERLDKGEEPYRVHQREIRALLDLGGLSDE